VSTKKTNPPDFILPTENIHQSSFRVFRQEQPQVAPKSDFLFGAQYNEDSFDLESFKKAAIGESRKKTEAKRARRQISIGKALLTIAALLVFVILFFVIMDALGYGAF